MGTGKGRSCRPDRKHLGWKHSFMRGGNTMFPCVAEHGGRAQVSQQMTMEKPMSQQGSARAAGRLALVHVPFPSKGWPSPRRAMGYPTPSRRLGSAG